MILYLSDARARRQARDLIAAHRAVDSTAQAVLAGGIHRGSLKALLDRMDAVVAEITRTVDEVRDQRLAKALVAVRDSHVLWLHAKIGSDKEREYASVFVRRLDELERLVG